MKKLYSEYKSLLKNPNIEENIDLLIFRPLAYVLVKIIHRFPVTPNQLSLSSIGFGIFSGISFSFGTKESFVYGGILYGLTRVLDCADGMIARMKKNGSPVGRIIDGIVDYVNTIIVYVGIGFGLSKSGLDLPFNHWILLAIAGFCMAAHAMICDYYKQEFRVHALGENTSNREEQKMFESELLELEQHKSSLIDQFIIKIFLKYLKIQGTGNHKKANYDQKKYYQINVILMRFWTMIASSAHILIIMISALLFEPRILFYFSIVAANIWVLILWNVQTYFNKKIVITS